MKSVPDRTTLSDAGKSSKTQKGKRSFFLKASAMIQRSAASAAKHERRIPKLKGHFFHYGLDQTDRFAPTMEAYVDYV